MFVHGVKHFEVHITARQPDLPTACPQICYMLLDAVDSAATAFNFINSQANIVFQCPCSPDDVHTAILSSDCSHLMCTVTEDISEDPLTKAQKVWLGHNPNTGRQ